MGQGGSWGLALVKHKYISTLPNPIPYGGYDVLVARWYVG